MGPAWADPRPDLRRRDRAAGRGRLTDVGSKAGAGSRQPWTGPDARCGPLRRARPGPPYPPPTAGAEEDRSSRDRHPARPVESQPPWIRADGLAKVTGQARYTADLAFPGSPTPGSCSPAEPTPGSCAWTRPRPGRCPGVLAVLTAATTCRSAATARSTRPRPDAVRPGRRPVRGRGRRRGRGADPGDRRRPRSRPIEVELRGAPGRSSTSRPRCEPGSPLVHEAVADYAPRPEHRAEPATSPAARRSSRATWRRPSPARRRRRPRALRRRHGPPGPDRAPRRDRRVGGRQGDGLSSDPGAVPRPGPDAPRSSRCPSTGSASS